MTAFAGIRTNRLAVAILVAAAAGAMWVERVRSAAVGWRETGRASYYGDLFEGRPTASGEPYVHHKMTAAHRTLPFGTRIKVTHRNSGRSVIVRINDRGPAHASRILDLSRAAAERIGLLRDGTGPVALVVIATGASSDSPRPPDAAGTAVLAERRFFRVQSELVHPRGYGVQIGSYREVANMMQVVDGLRRQTSETVLIEVHGEGGGKVYRVLVGEKATRQSAADLQERLRKWYSDCFILSLGAPPESSIPSP
jgi:rare lipoprotein A